VDKYIRIYFFIQKKVFILYKQLKTIDMAIRIQSYYKTTETTIEQLQRDLKMCSSQEQEVLNLFKKYGTMTTWDVVDVYSEVIGAIQYTSAGRSVFHLHESGAIKEVGTIQGPLNRPVQLYTLTDITPTIIKKSTTYKIPTSIKVDVILDSEGMIDVDKMYDELAEKIVFLTNKYKL